MASHTKEIDMNQGEFVGEGDTSCIIKNPPFKCTNVITIKHTQIPPDTELVTKIIYRGRNHRTTEGLYDLEMENAQKVALLDPQQEYFIYPIEGCKLELTKNYLTGEQIINYMIGKCPLDEKKIGSLHESYNTIYLLRMPLGKGETLSTYVETHKNISDADINDILLKICACLSITHNDMKLDAILYDEQTKNVRLIDLGERAEKGNNSDLKNMINIVIPDLIKNQTHVTKYKTNLNRKIKNIGNINDLATYLEKLYTDSLTPEERINYENEVRERTLAKIAAIQRHDGSPPGSPSHRSPPHGSPNVTPPHGSPNVTPPHGRHHGSPSHDRHHGSHKKPRNNGGSSSGGKASRSRKSIK
uniref:Protein kinase domain-containing protein n=1 Tax=viral metagenome TaxID=1070528 RepID=A0A6C0KUJ3_9ZZZZ